MKKNELFEKAEREFTPLCRLNNCQAYIGYFYIDDKPVYVLKSYNTITAVAFICDDVIDGEHGYIFERDYYSQTSSKHLSKFMCKISKAHSVDIYRIRFSVWIGNHLSIRAQKHHEENGWQDVIDKVRQFAFFVDVDKIKGV